MPPVLGQIIKDQQQPKYSEKSSNQKSDPSLAGKKVSVKAVSKAEIPMEVAKKV